MFDFHYDRTRYFNMQSQNARDFVIPFIEKYFFVDFVKITQLIDYQLFETKYCVSTFNFAKN